MGQAPYPGWWLCLVSSERGLPLVIHERALEPGWECDEPSSLPAK
jgi:hypothetical protein